MAEHSQAISTVAISAVAISTVECVTTLSTERDRHSMR